MFRGLAFPAGHPLTIMCTHRGPAKPVPHLLSTAWGLSPLAHPPTCLQAVPLCPPQTPLPRTFLCVFKGQGLSCAGQVGRQMGTWRMDSWICRLPTAAVRNHLLEWAHCWPRGRAFLSLGLACLPSPTFQAPG